MSGARPPQRWLQFSLQTLLLAVLLVAMFFGGRESARPLIEAERKRAEKAERDFSLAQAQMRSANLQQKVWWRERALAASQELQDEAERAARRAQRNLEEMQRELDRVRDEHTWPAPKYEPRVLKDFDPNHWKKQPINEYWQRKGRPRRLPESFAVAISVSLLC